MHLSRLFSRDGPIHTDGASGDEPGDTGDRDKVGRGPCTRGRPRSLAPESEQVQNHPEGERVKAIA